MGGLYNSCGYPGMDGDDDDYGDGYNRRSRGGTGYPTSGGSSSGSSSGSSRSRSSRRGNSRPGDECLRAEEAAPADYRSGVRGRSGPPLENGGPDTQYYDKDVGGEHHEVKITETSQGVTHATSSRRDGPK